jgi:hypothetical protein
MVMTVDRKTIVLSPPHGSSWDGKEKEPRHIVGTSVTYEVTVIEPKCQFKDDVAAAENIADSLLDAWGYNDNVEIMVRVIRRDGC